ncbi:fatty acid cis/trans isomerase [Roseibium sediminicola]|uniref:Fatty acid cis/trans isomerase n=1 Tax=Roseibium sediminicola TaxID=2933272 RepID=A0ABT0GNC5_9HYPH|nr:fatty acid cis/trans isomerase [Roseibium sp. CAU 1639]MCK7610904.1 fatty acid cis/trans isomerase [Roseibium sp. CAU 1639]
MAFLARLPIAIRSLSSRLTGIGTCVSAQFVIAFALASPGTAQQAASPIHDVLNKRCVVCHGCYDAPCQLKLSSPAGWARGASKQKVYDSTRLDDAPMTRLGIDARTVPAWRQKGFFSVTDKASGKSVLEKLLQAGRDNPFKMGAPLPDSIDISTLRKNACPADEDIAGYLDEHPQGGMPFAMAPLPDADFQRLISWAADGAPAPEKQKALPGDIREMLASFETFLNGDEPRTRLVARYLYEHLFLAHLHLEGDTPRRFFRLIRSRTKPGTAAEEIATRRPFDDPGGPFFYRLVPLEGTILHKEHMVYEIGPERLERYQQLFLDDEWTLAALPPYSSAAGGNPLSTFRAIPARSRYQFLLDDALYFVRSFIRGPVCYGQVAVNVIEDRFWVSFLDPDADLSVTDPAYLNKAIPILELPVAQSEGKVADRLKNFLQLGPVKYQEFRQSRYARRYAEEGGPGYEDIWHGAPDNADARLTIYRNFSSASVTTGFTGAVPETAWVIDFPLFERIYYNLVAGFDVFGNVEHQLTTRIYMDSLRREGERIFLSFLPPDQRDRLHESWYQGPLVNLVDLWKESALDETSPTGIAFESSDPKAEFLTHLLALNPKLWPVTDPINRCKGEACAPSDTIAGKLRPLTGRPAPFAKYLPDIAVLLVETDQGDRIFSLVHDEAHANVAFLFNEDLRRQPEQDTLTVVPGQFSSYPNFIFRMRENRLADFVAAVREIRTQDDYLGVVAEFGIRRTHKDFWQVYDRVQAALNAQDAIEAGLLDLNRYRDPKAPDPIERLFEFTFKVE